MRSPEKYTTPGCGNIGQMLPLVLRLGEQVLRSILC